MSSKLHKSPEYRNFRATVPLKKVCVDDDVANEWNVYEAGPRNTENPVICLPPISGTADIFYKQILAISVFGFRIFSVEYPVYWDYQQFCIGFKKFLDHFQLSKVHLVGASLGGFLSQKFAEMFPEKVKSLILCNAFADTSIFEQSSAASTFWMLPCIILRKKVSGSLKVDSSSDIDVKESINFVLESLMLLSQKQLSSRLTLNCLESVVSSASLSDIPITIMTVKDRSAICENVQEDLLQRYQHARKVSLETGGNFPYLSKAEEFNNQIKIHLDNSGFQPENYKQDQL